MPSESRKHLFVSYAQQDADPVQRIVNALQEEYRVRALPIDVWMIGLGCNPASNGNNL